MPEHFNHIYPHTEAGRIILDQPQVWESRFLSSSKAAGRKTRRSAKTFFHSLQLFYDVVNVVQTATWGKGVTEGEMFLPVQIRFKYQAKTEETQVQILAVGILKCDFEPEIPFNPN